MSNRLIIFVNLQFVIHIQRVVRATNVSTVSGVIHVLMSTNVSTGRIIVILLEQHVIILLEALHVLM